jgi:hypothetical protein
MLQLNMGEPSLFLESFVHEAATHKDIHWTVLVSQERLNIPVSDNLQVVTMKWPKLSWFHRLFFELIYLNYLYDLESFDSVVSLQNILLLRKRIRVNRLILIHHPVQFFKGRFNLINVEGIKMFFRKYFIGNLIRLSVAKADVILVQTKWMKDAVNNWGTTNKVHLISTPIDVAYESVSMFDYKQWDGSYFYPAHAGYAKNHQFLIKLLLHLKKIKGHMPTIYLTVDKDENDTAKRFIADSENE